MLSYADPLLANTLASSTYPLEIIQLQQWLDKNKDLKDKALADAVAKQPWDSSVQSMAASPEVVQRMAGNIQWTTDLGNAFLGQQADVMAAVQRMRAKAQGTGNLKTSAQQVVETQTVEGGKEVIVVKQADPETVYVPSYDPTVVYGAAPASYPYYPYTYPGYVAGAALAFGGAVAWGAAWNNWGNCNWNGNGDININNNNNFNKNNINRNNINNRPGQGGGNWQHNPQHRGNAPDADRGTASKYGGRAQGQQRPGGANAAGNRPGGGAGNVAGNRPGGPGGGQANRPGGGAGGGQANRPGGGAGGGGKRTGRAVDRLIGPAAAKLIGPAAAVELRVQAVAEIRLVTALYPRVQRAAAAVPWVGVAVVAIAEVARASSSRGGKSMGGGGMSRGGGGGGGRGGGGGGGGRRR